MLYGDVGLANLIPLPLMGDGMLHLTNFVLQIANAQNGVVLIDEIENGLHYSVMTNVWKAIASAAKEYNTQVFATTHSWECIRYAHEAFSSEKTYDEDFRLHRLDRQDDGEITVVTYDQESLGASLEFGMEVR
jgi:AAA15 family ATPase/GTPase